MKFPPHSLLLFLLENLAQEAIFFFLMKWSRAAPSSLQKVGPDSDFALSRILSANSRATVFLYEGINIAELFNFSRQSKKFLQDKTASQSIVPGFYYQGS